MMIPNEIIAAHVKSFTEKGNQSPEKIATYIRSLYASQLPGSTFAITEQILHDIPELPTPLQTSLMSIFKSTPDSFFTIIELSYLIKIPPKPIAESLQSLFIQKELIKDSFNNYALYTTDPSQFFNVQTLTLYAYPNLIATPTSPTWKKSSDTTPHLSFFIP